MHDMNKKGTALCDVGPLASLRRRGVFSPEVLTFLEAAWLAKIYAIAASNLPPISRYGVRLTACITLSTPQKHIDINLHGPLLPTGLFLPWLQFSGSRIVIVQPGATLLLLSPSSPFGLYSAFENSKVPKPFLNGKRVFLDGRHPAFSGATAFPPTVLGSEVFDPLIVKVAPVFVPSVFCLFHTCHPNKSTEYFPNAFPSP